jgi:hypothetical protein
MESREKVIGEEFFFLFKVLLVEENPQEPEGKLDED